MEDKIKFCVWDVGGVIYPYNFRAFDAWLKENSSDWENVVKREGKPIFNAYMKGEISSEEFCRQICRHYNVEIKDIKKVVAEVKCTKKLFS